MPKEGLEPPLLTEQVPKTCVAAVTPLGLKSGGEENRTPNPAVQKPCVTISTTPPKIVRRLPATSQD